jgi:hypothetical protein
MIFHDFGGCLKMEKIQCLREIFLIMIVVYFGEDHIKVVAEEKRSLIATERVVNKSSNFGYEQRKK